MTWQTRSSLTPKVLSENQWQLHWLCVETGFTHFQQGEKEKKKKKNHGIGTVLLCNSPKLDLRKEDSNGPQLPSPHTLEPGVDECSFEVHSTVPVPLLFSNSLWRSLMCTLVLMFLHVHGTDGFTWPPNHGTIRVKCLAQGHKKRHKDHTHHNVHDV